MSMCMDSLPLTAEKVLAAIRSTANRPPRAGS